MKKYIPVVMLILISMTSVQAQRMLPGQKGVEINAGTLPDNPPDRNYYLGISMTVNAKNGNYQIWALEYSHQNYTYKDLRVPHETYTAEGGYSFFLLGDARRNITLNTALTGLIGYESINRGEQMLYDGAKLISEDNFIYGAGGRLSMETYLSDHIVLLLQGRLKALWGTDLKQFRPAAGLGLRYNF
ncbi:hypothetical protein L1276_000930 [Flavobacterium sp. HSC-32F16]|uniref:conjugal transfer protein TraO n=1 Tax=Flavobacterium sp. HSC-32F16 TaxID=2910964 RepID=UPI0020A2756A|nr:conjugal transfer protein TraO [Flavobacterium sp. HSC-32F16]MCP2025790.1 hypothetical protein [Flavobacterium sp. HSC-32F16]